MEATAKQIRRCPTCGRPEPVRARMRSTSERLPLPLEHALDVIRRKLVEARQDFPAQLLTARPPPTLGPVPLTRRRRYRKAG